MLYMVDVVSDIHLAYIYYGRGDIWWASLTCALILVAGIGMSLYSLDVCKGSRWLSKFDSALFMVSSLLLVSPVFWLLQMIKRWKELRISYKERDEEKRKEIAAKVDGYDEMNRIFTSGCREMPSEDTRDFTMILIKTSKNFAKDKKKQKDAILLEKLQMYDKITQNLCKVQMIESFLECAPQMVLQLYIGLSLTFEEALVIKMPWLFSILSSWASVCFVMANYYNSLHPTVNVSIRVTFLLLIPWQLFTIGSRVLSLALFASVYPWWTLIVGILHTLVMFVFRQISNVLESIKHSRARSQLTLISDLAVSMAYLFSFNPKMLFGLKCSLNFVFEQYCFYYVFSFIFNLILTFMWLHSQRQHIYTRDTFSYNTHTIHIVNFSSHNQINDNATTVNSSQVALWDNDDKIAPMWFQMVAMNAVCLGFFIGIAFMLVYYCRFHHKKKLIMRKCKTRCNIGKYLSWLPCCDRTVDKYDPVTMTMEYLDHSYKITTLMQNDTHENIIPTSNSVPNAVEVDENISYIDDDLYNASLGNICHGYLDLHNASLGTYGSCDSIDTMADYSSDDSLEFIDNASSVDFNDNASYYTCITGPRDTDSFRTCGTSLADNDSYRWCGTSLADNDSNRISLFPDDYISGIGESNKDPYNL